MCMYRQRCGGSRGLFSLPPARAALVQVTFRRLDLFRCQLYDSPHRSVRSHDQVLGGSQKVVQQGMFHVIVVPAQRLFPRSFPVAVAPTGVFPVQYPRRVYLSVTALLSCPLRHNAKRGTPGGVNDLPSRCWPPSPTQSGSTRRATRSRGRGTRRPATS